MELAEVKQNCIHFRGNIPCKPNKTEGVHCSNCTAFQAISKRILIIKLGALGDVIRTTPLVVKYKEMFPNCHITWLTHSPAVLPTDSIQRILQPDAFSLLLLSNSSFDIAINLDKEEEACILLQQVNAKEKYGYIWENNQLSPATSAAEHKIMTGLFDDLSQANTKSYVQEIFDICHQPFNFEPYLIRKNEEMVAHWKAHFEQLANGKQIVGLNTGCGPRWNTRLWSEAAWQEVAHQLIQQGFFPVFLGGELEHEKNQRMSHATGTYYPGHFSLEEFIALTDSCSIIVTQVSMMMHIATALQKQLVLMNTIFNSNEFELYGRGKIVSPPNGCDCYFGNSCKHGNSCMHEILPTMVCEAVQYVSSQKNNKA